MGMGMGYWCAAFFSVLCTLLGLGGCKRGIGCYWGRRWGWGSYEIVTLEGWARCFKIVGLGVYYTYKKVEGMKMGIFLTLCMSILLYMSIMSWLTCSRYLLVVWRGGLEISIVSPMNTQLIARHAGEASRYEKPQSWRDGIVSHDCIKSTPCLPPHPRQS